jgi:hypothetical protein
MQYHDVSMLDNEVHFSVLGRIFGSQRLTFIDFSKKKAHLHRRITSLEPNKVSLVVEQRKVCFFFDKRGQLVFFFWEHEDS